MDLYCKYDIIAQQAPEVKYKQHSNCVLSSGSSHKGNDTDRQVVYRLQIEPQFDAQPMSGFHSGG